MQYVNLPLLLSRLAFGTAAAALVTGCSLEANITSDVPVTPLPSVDLDPFSRQSPDFIPGEVVTTTLGTPGMQVKAVFGETPEKQTTANGWTVEGVFNE